MKTALRKTCCWLQLFQQAVEAIDEGNWIIELLAAAQDRLVKENVCPVGKGSRYGDAQLAYHYAPRRSRIRLG